MELNHKNYYFTLVIITLVWIFLGKEYYSNYAPIVLCFFGFPVYVFLYFKHLGAFSDKLRTRDFNLFKKYCAHAGYFKDEMIHSFNLFNNSDFEKLTDQELLEHYRLAKSSVKYALLIFVTFPAITILLIMIQ